MAQISNYNPLYDPATDNAPIDPAVQTILNKPLLDDSGFDETDETFLNEVMAKFENNIIQPHTPSSLLNNSVYNTLDEFKKGKADQNAFIMLTTLRNIYDLWKIEPRATYQIKNQIRHIRLIKERVEAEMGDVYIV
ncbi:MAG: hypothetical protein UT36_C0010G0036 [Candidatus Peregrinibacteria bacterium GW2011_GWF2_39_17]|nr:MAG: hypothetical protein UT36_C0010G0036 [Candidatus Peregrinibacteria bacterium GW2011_GWF2_39_17]HCW32282.1 hypothetical protein [Candidatus Peregrinibacteria bacterium]